MKKYKRFSLIFFAIIILVACLPLEAFAIDPVSAIGLAGAIDAYGMTYGIGTVYDVANSDGIDTSFAGLWDEFSEYQQNNNAENPTINGVSTSYDDYISEWQENYNSLHAFSHSSGKFAAWYIDAESAAVFDQFWNWVLTGPAEMVRVDNSYFEFSSSQIGDNAIPITIQSNSSLALGDIPLYEVVVGYNYVSSTSYRDVESMSAPFYFYVYENPYGNKVASLITQTSNATIRYKVGQYYTTYAAQNAVCYPADNNQYPAVVPRWYAASTWTLPANTFYDASFNDLRNYYTIPAGDYSDGLTTQSDTIGIKAYNDDGISDLPNPNDLDYVPTPVTIVTSIPWDNDIPDYDEDEDSGVPVPWPTDSVPDIIDNIGDNITDDTYTLEDINNNTDPEPEPSEVFLPFIPVGIPSFNFNLSGIWHYVREWVASISAWLSLMFSIWASLPYAMIVPVYASIVIIIVLGVYKRFFM